MSVSTAIVIAVIGAAMGWAATQFVKLKGLGLPGNVVVGVVGAFLGDFLFDLLDIHGGLFDRNFYMVKALVGAAIALLILKLIKK